MALEQGFTYSMPLEVYLQGALVRGVLTTNQDRLSNFLVVREGEDVFSLNHASLETFDQTAPPALPAGWGRWSTDGTAVFQTVAGQGLGGSIGLVSSAGSRTAGLAWYPQQVSGDTGASLSVNANALAPSFVLARGSNLGNPSSRTYLAAVVSRGLKVDLWEVRPGVTGWAQVRYTYGASTEDALQKLQYDLYYIKNSSFALDFFIIFDTIKTVIRQRGA